jgi:hypothetical protein
MLLNNKNKPVQNYTDQTFYKRNQIVEAIARIYDPSRQDAPMELRTRIKRLFELDRAMGRRPRSNSAEMANFAFFSDEAPGTGADVAFSEYEAFALLNGLIMMDHGWPQSFAVSIMRRIRPDLEREHARILQQLPKELFDRQAIVAKARPGDIALDNSDPVFIAVLTKVQRASGQAQAAPLAAVCRGMEGVAKLTRNGCSSLTMFEVATLAHKLRQALMNTEPRRRGRG